MKFRIACAAVAFLSVVVPMAAQTTTTQTSSSTGATAQLPRLVKFSGTLKDQHGNALPDVVGVTFALYSGESGGAPLWLETQNVHPDKNGHYTILLGSTRLEGLPADLFVSEQAQWLGVQPEGKSEQARVLLVAVPYALKAADADTLGGKPLSAFVTTDSQTTSAQTSSNAATNAGTTTPKLSQGVSRDSSKSINQLAPVGGTGATNFIPRWTNSTTLGNSVLFQLGGNVGVSTVAPKLKFEIDSGNMLVRGPNNFLATGNTAFLFVGDTNHPIEALYNRGLAIGAYKVPQAIFIADVTGRVGIGTTTPTTGMLNTVANGKSVIGLFTVGWNATAGSGLAGTDAIHATGGNADPDNGAGGGAGAVISGGTGFFGSGGAGAVITGGGGTNVANGGPGITVHGGQDLDDFAGGDAIVATGGDFGGIGVVASGGGGAEFDPGVPGIMTTGGFGGGGVTNGPGIVATGASDSGFDNGGDGIDAIAGTGSGGYTNGNAGSFTGNVAISGNLNVSGTKSFQIDHPLDPANKYLYHAALESSEVLNLYTGNSVLDASGEATVQFPDWLEALNRDFRYQLTAIGAPAPNLHVAQEIKNHSFKIAGGAAGMKVSWQVTGVRQDAWEKAHPMEVEVPKPARERGYFINPELFGAPNERSIAWARNPRLMMRVREMHEKQVKQAQIVLAKPRGSRKR
jgi:trimeric autotransporter adhesin